MIPLFAASGRPEWPAPAVGPVETMVRPPASVGGREGKTYYVSASRGNDAWNGTSRRRPWRTLHAVSKRRFEPGDRILLRRGDIWRRQELILRGSGDFVDDSWISLGAYGRGRKPRIARPPYDRRWPVAWQAVNKVYDPDRTHMKIAIRIKGNGWFVSGLAIKRAEMGIFVPSGSRYWFEDINFNHIRGLMMPIVPGWEEKCAVECPMWDPYPEPDWGNAIEVNADHVVVRDVVVKRSTGGIGGFVNVGLIENVFIDRVTTGGLNVNGTNLTIRYATVLNGQWPDGAWYGADPLISNWDAGVVVERTEIAYTQNYDRRPGQLTGIQDASPIDFDLESVNSGVYDSFFHDNVGSCVEFNMGGGGNRNITVANNVCFNNGLEDDPRPDGDYARVAFAADACGFHKGQSYTIEGNSIYKAFPGQHLNYHFGAPVTFADEFATGVETCGHVVRNNAIYEFGDYELPLPVPEPPPIDQENIASTASVDASSGDATAAAALDGSLDTEWVSDEAKPWIVYAWDAPQTIDRIRLFDRPDLDEWGASGVLAFSDGTHVDVTGGILNNGSMREVILDTPKSVTWMAYRVSRNDANSPGTNVGLAELQVYRAAAPEPPAPMPSPGRMVVDFSDRADAPTSLTFQRYPDGANGIDWAGDVWFTAAEQDTGDRYLFLDFPRGMHGEFATRGPVFILPRGKVLRSVEVSCPAGAKVAFIQVGQPVAEATCDGRARRLHTRWSKPLASDVVTVWIDVTGAEASASVSDAHFDDLIYKG